MVRNRLYKSAFTMIELIFAIVIIAISVISLPMMTQATGKSMEGSLAQEAIFAASAQLNMVLSYPWDVDSQETPGELSKVIHTSANDCNTSNGAQRPGHVHRMCLDDNTTSPSVLSPVGSDSLDGRRTTTDEDIFVAGAASQSGYKERYTMEIAVDFSTFGSSTNNNMKEIEITIKDSEGDLVVLKTYSANIGEAEAAKRMF